MPLAAPRRLLAVGLLLSSFALVAPARAGWNHDPYIPTPVSAGTGNQYTSNCLSDGAGGMFIAWTDERNGSANGDIYAQHLDAAGNALWTAGGVAVCTAPNIQAYPVLCSDGASGFYVAWGDYRANAASGDVYVQRVGSNGAAYPGWPVNGLLLSGATDDQYPYIAADGVGGVFVGWTAVYGATDTDPQIQHVSAAGAKWSVLADANNGLQLANVTSLTVSNGNAFIVWLDKRSGTQYDIYYQSYQADGTALYATGGIQATNTNGVSENGAIAVSDGYGGIWLGFDDGQFIQAQRRAPNGSFEYGGSYASAAGTRYLYSAKSDGGGGIYLLWADGRAGNLFTSDLYATHILGGGMTAGGWTLNGTLIASDLQALAVTAVNDGQMGLLLSWEGNDSNYMLHLTSNAGLWPGWPSSGRAYGPPSFLTSVCGDGAQGALAAIDYAYGSDYNVYAQHIERYSQLGDPTPASTAAKDAKNDQGGNLKVSWSASYLDAPPNNVVTAYDLWRSVPAATAAAALRAGATLVSADDVPPANLSGARRIMAPTATSGYYWEYVGRQVANSGTGYSYVVPTLGDSIGGSNPYTVVKVRALPAYGTAFWESAPDSGYSVDNLPPVAPAPFAATFFSATGTVLTWGANGEADLAGYRVYRGSTPAFVPGPGNLVTQTTQPNYTDAGTHSFVYKLSAVDIHGNESRFVTALPSGTTDVGGTQLPREVFLAPVTPNPARGGAFVHFGLPAAARAELSLYDAAGRRVRSLAGGVQDAGEHAIRWDGLDESGAPVASGLLFVRLETGAITRVQRMVVVR